MTIGEVQRQCEANIFILEAQRKEKAQFDYTHATLILSGVGRIMGGKGKFPTIEKAYPNLFKEEDFKPKDNSINNFMKFAHSFNANFKESEVDNG